MMKLSSKLGQPSWRLANDHVEAFLTQMGGQLAPVTFQLKNRTVQPLSVAPWHSEKIRQPAILQALRGDFFCMPFGGGAKAWKGELHPIHGETANCRWEFVELRKDSASTTLACELATKIRSGKVRKEISLRAGETVVYSKHVISGMKGPMPLGHHAMLYFPEESLFSTSRIRHGQVFPFAFESPALGGYSTLKPGAHFRDLTAVPMLDGSKTDLSRFPAREGFEDLVQITHRAADDFAWEAVVFPKSRYVWFALKDPRILASTILWISNGGRHYAPWSGRHRRVMGIEDVTSYFHLGLAESAKRNPLEEAGIPTCLRLDPKKETPVRYVFGVSEIPAGFGAVSAIVPGAGWIDITEASGRSIRCRVDCSHLYAG